MLVDLIDALSSDFDHEVIYFHEGPHRQTLENRGVICYQIRGVVALYDPIFWFRLIQAIKKAHPDCIHSLLWGANWASRLVGPFLKIPVVNALHNNVQGYSRARFLLDRLTLARADHFIAVSKGVADSHVVRYPSLLKNALNVIPNGVTVSQAAGLDRALFGFTTHHFVVGFVGRFEPEKNPALLVEAFDLLVNQVPQARLLLVGYGSQETLLKNRVKIHNLEDKVVFVIGQPAAPYYTLFDCFVLSSPREGLSIALLEAMGKGLACVITSTDREHPVIVHDQNGYLVSLYTAEALADALQEISRDKEKAQRLGESAQKTVLEDYTVEHMARAYGEIFHSCIKKTAPKTRRY